MASAWLLQATNCAMLRMIVSFVNTSGRGKSFSNISSICFCFFHSHSLQFEVEWHGGWVVHYPSHTALCISHNVVDSVGTVLNYRQSGSISTSPPHSHVSHHPCIVSMLSISQQLYLLANKAPATLEFLHLIPTIKINWNPLQEHQV